MMDHGVRHVTLGRGPQHLIELGIIVGVFHIPNHLIGHRRHRGVLTVFRVHIVGRLDDLVRGEVRLKGESIQHRGCFSIELSHGFHCSLPTSFSRCNRWKWPQWTSCVPGHWLTNCFNRYKTMLKRIHRLSRRVHKVANNKPMWRLVCRIGLFMSAQGLSCFGGSRGWDKDR